ncbi:MAG: hypothetical protein DCF25_14275 [Leptolyngbya foveolarum]|uniref:Metallo-beta-lactamase domain-containing protein n=1 Tax=Leptolyngbya foveolarum TaxID=47253 RepID=A0A2W4W787_9CYAN|nr:MAG: hypothetical protein DCF25_14275 [Leptolyngbya foveolarum]
MTELACFPYGVGYQHEGVCLRIQIGPYSILLDCGLADIEPLKENAADFVLCSHAHTDHIRGLLPLHRAFPHLPIFSSDVTARLIPLNWPGQEDTNFCRTLPWRSPIEIAPGLTVQLWPAGHLPGAACFLITYETSDRTFSVFYSGDCFLSNGRLVEGMPLTELRNLKPDVMIVEGSYGTERHPHRKQQENYLLDCLSEALKEKNGHPGRAVFPCPLLGLGQELLMLMRSHHRFTGQPVDIWVDPLIAMGCDAYLGCLSAFPATVKNFAQHQPLFWDERVLPRIRRLEAGTSPKALAVGIDPAIFIVHPATLPSTYCQGDQGNWTVFSPDPADISLWQGQIAEQSPESRFDWLGALESQTAAGEVKMEHYMLTNHCDGGGTKQLIHNLRPQHVVFVHGESQQLTNLANLDDLQSRYQLHLPTTAQLMPLPLAEAFWQPAPPSNNQYEGEVESTPAGIAMLLPKGLENDVRWAQLADTGIVEATWQGNQLVIRGLNQKELMKVGPRPKRASVETDQTCYHCRHLRGQRCRNPESPLVGLPVTSDGSCGAFERSRPGWG